MQFAGKLNCVMIHGTKTKLTMVIKSMPKQAKFQRNASYLSNYVSQEIKPVDMFVRKSTSQYTPVTPESGPPVDVFMFHDLYGSSENWNVLSRLLCTNSHVGPLAVTAMDVRNHGNTAHADEHDYESMAVDVKHYMDKNKIQKAIMVGHGVGGKLAMFYALVEPDRCERVVVLDSAPVAYDAVAEGAKFDTFNKINLEALKGKQEADEIFSKTFLDKTERNYVLKNLTLDNQSKKFKWKCNLPAILKGKDKLISFPTITTPPFAREIMFVGGTKAGRVGAEHRPTIQKLFTNSRIEMLNGGHFVHAQKPSIVAQMIATFVNEIKKQKQAAAAAQAKQ